jgi:Transcriptional regulator, AbiEi antitoxin
MRESESPPPWLAVSELAGRQWGVVSLAQLRALGVGRSAITRRVRAGQLHRLHPAVYSMGHCALRAEGHRLAAVLACGPGAVLIDVTAPRRRHGAPGIRLHRSRSLDAQDTTHHEGIPITTISRTLLDLAATARPSELERALAQSERLKLYDHRAIQATIARSSEHRGVHGALGRAGGKRALVSQDDSWAAQCGQRGHFWGQEPHNRPLSGVARTEDDRPRSRRLSAASPR